MPYAQLRSRPFFRFIACVTAALCVALPHLDATPFRGAKLATPQSGDVIIVLPPRLVAGQPATLAVFGADGKLAPDVGVELRAVPSGESQSVRTNSTGRVSFIAPAASGSLIATSEGATAAALLDAPQATAAPPAAAPQSAPNATARPLQLAPVVSLRGAFPICGGGFRGDANENHVKINVEVSLIVAASPECLVIIAPSNMPAGPAKISIETAGNEIGAATTLVSLVFAPPNPPLAVGKQSAVVLGVEGSADRLRVAVSNPSPDVLHFVKGDTQELWTSAGVRNSVAISATALRSGDYSFRARLIPAPDALTAARYLEVAAPLGGKSQQAALTKLAARLAHHPRDAAKVRPQIQIQMGMIAAGPGAYDLRTLLDSAARLLE
jgi:hypothetical protein